MGAVVSPWRSETISQKQEGAGRHSSPDEKTHVCGPLSSAQAFYIGWCGAVCFRCPDLFSRIKTNSIPMTDWLTEKELLLKDPIVPPTQDSLPPPKVALVQMERCSTWKSERLHRGSLTIWRLGNHTHTNTHKHAQNTSLKEPIQREEFCQFLYRLYLKHWSSQIRSIPRHQRHSLFYLHLTRTMHLKTYLEQSCKIFDPQHWRLMGIFRIVRGEASTSVNMQCTPQ